MRSLSVFSLLIGTAPLAWCAGETGTVPSVPSAPPAIAQAVAPAASINLPAAITDFRPEQWFNPTGGDGVDTDNGTLNWKGRTFDIGTSRAFRARFERYLNIGSADVEKLKAYQAQLAEVQALLSPLNEIDGANVDANVDKAYRILYAAAKYPGDAGTSTTLAHMIFNSWRLRAEIRADGRTLDQLNRAADRMDQAAKNRAAMNSMSGLDGKASAPPPSLNLSMDAGSLSRNDQMAGKTVAEILPAKIQFAKLGFQSQIVYFLLQRRYEHVVMATSFYRLIFKGSAQELQAGRDQLKSLLPSADMVYSVEALERLANEAITDVGGTMEVIRGAIKNRDLNNATERLQETFHLGEFLAAVTTLPEAERRTVRDYYRLLREARDFANLKDYTRLLASSARLKEMSADYNHIKVQSEAEAAMQASNLTLASAKMELGRNGYTEAQKLLREATALWPLNPSLATFTAGVNEQGDAGAQMVRRFDEALERKDPRAIFDARHEMGLGLFKDTVRGPQLKAIIDQVAQTDLLLGQAKMFIGQNNPFGAWESVMMAEKILPQDREVFALKSTLLTQAVDFAKLLEGGRLNEDKRAWGVSLALYQKAMDLYPASQFAREGLARVVPKLLAEAGGSAK